MKTWCLGGGSLCPPSAPSRRRPSSRPRGISCSLGTAGETKRCQVKVELFPPPVMRWWDWQEGSGVQGWSPRAVAGLGLVCPSAKTPPRKQKGHGAGGNPAAWHWARNEAVVGFII